MSSTDPQLDALLREVPLPEGLVDRLRAVAIAEDEDIDGALSAVPVPQGLFGRLRQIPLGDDEGLDAALRNVPIPTRLMAAWRRQSKKRDRFVRLSRLTLATSLLIAVTLSFLSALLLSMAMNRGPFHTAQQDKPAPENTAPGLSPGALVNSWSSEPPEEVSDAGPLALAPPVALANLDPRPARPGADQLGGGLNLPSSADPLLRPAQSALGYNSFDELPELPKRAADLIPRGLDWPLVAGSNQAFLIRYGFHPFVSPAAHPRLQTMPVPLGAETASYELARRYLEDGELPPPDTIRTEEFLAAVDYEYPRPEKRDLGLTLAAGPSPLSGEGFSLVQVGVQARPLPHTGHAPVQVVLVVDTSASMQWGSRLTILRRALKDLVNRLDGGDRLSLVSFSQGAHVLVQDVARDEIGYFLAAVNSLTAEGSTDVAAGLREAYALARSMAAPGRPPLRIVLLTDGLLELERSWAEQIERQAAEAAGRGLRLDVIDLGQQKQGDPQLAGFAQAGQGTVHRAGNGEQIRWALDEIMTGRSPWVARGAQLKVTFNPKTVLEYRLLGHEAKEWARMLPASPKADFRDGQSSTALYEVRLAGTATGEVAAAELTWQSEARPRDKAEKLTARLDHQDIAMAWAQTAPSLQEAAIVAQTAEVLRKSPFVQARNPRSSMAAALTRLWELSGQVDCRVYLRPSYLEFATLIEQATKAKSARNGVRRP